MATAMIREKLQEVLELIPNLRVLTCVMVWNADEPADRPPAVMTRRKRDPASDLPPATEMADYLLTSSAMNRVVMDLSSRVQRHILVLDNLLGDSAVTLRRQMQALQEEQQKATDGDDSKSG